MSDYNSYIGGSGGSDGGPVSPKSLTYIQQLVLSFAIARPEFNAPETVDAGIMPPIDSFSDEKLDELLESLSRVLRANDVFITLVASAVRGAKTWDDIAREIFQRQKGSGASGGGGGSKTVAPEQPKAPAPRDSDRKQR